MSSSVMFKIVKLPDGSGLVTRASKVLSLRTSKGSTSKVTGMKNSASSIASLKIISFLV
jgi:hypothetical protein